MKTVLKVIGGLLGLVVVLGLCGYTWAAHKTNTLMARTIAVHSVDFPIPFPLADSEIARLKLTRDSALTLATARAVDRGKHLVEARFACRQCHGMSFGGGTMVDVAPIGRILGPNLTLGRGSHTANYRAADWDRIVRHGILPSGNPAVMPSEDFETVSDQELSDVISYIRSMPPVDSVVPPIVTGPLGKVLMATGKMRLAVDLITDHHATHAVYPPASVATIDFGKHLATVCAGCHHADFAGGQISGGDPSWPPSKNLTPHPQALGRWSYAQFKSTFQTGTRPDGTTLKAPMSMIVGYAKKMSDVEVEALWKYLQSLPAIAPPAK
jgi:mono/diheme cytochrome c family protein